MTDKESIIGFDGVKIKGTMKAYPPREGAIGWSISNYGCWIPGVYESEKAAWYAFELDDEVLSKLQDEANKADGLITYEMLMKAVNEEGEA